jgi:hypothetical protein
MKLKYYQYNVSTGIRKVKTKLAIAISALALIGGGAVMSFATFGSAHASPSSTFTLTPSTFVGAAGDCGTAYPAGTPGGVVSKWDNTFGNPAPSLQLQKNVPTADCSAAQATINGVSGITLSELNFDVNGYCGAGAPRFNVTTTDNVTHFFGCSQGTHSPPTNGWTHVVFAPSDGSAPVTANETVQSIGIVMDEMGQTHLDNISINNQVIGGPNTPNSKDDCKNGGWQTLQDSNGQAFKNQGQCVSSSEHSNGVGNDDLKVRKS